MSDKKQGRKAKDQEKMPAVESPARPGQKSVTVWLDNDLIEAMEAYRNSLRPHPSKTGTIETALQDFLAAKGFWDAKPDPEE